MSINKRVGENLKSTRKEIGMSIAELSRRTDISRVTIETYEKGISNMTLNNLSDLCDALNINIGKVFKK